MGLLATIRKAFAEEPASPEPARKPRRRYAGAHTGNLTSGWTTTSLTSVQTIKDNLDILRARSREQYENNPLMRRWAGLLKNNVVGPNGITMQARTVNPDGTPDKRANDALEAGWREWGREVDMSGRLSWREAQELFIHSVMMDGEVIAQKVRNRANPFGFSIDFIDPAYISTEFNETGKNGSRVVMGIEFDKWNRPTAYYLPDTEAIQSDSYYWHYNKPYKKVSANEILHSFKAERIDQLRGIPWASNALLRMNMLEGYTEAELIKARAESSKMLFMKQTAEDAASAIHDDSDDSGPIDEFAPGIIEYLDYGWEPHAFDPTSPNGNYAAFAKAMIRDIAASFGVSYFTLAADLEGVNYTSSRTGLLEDREAWKALQEWTVDKFCRPVYEAWLGPALGSGRLVLPNNGPSLRPAWEPKYRNVSWQGPRWQWVDPQKEVSAWDQKIRMGGGTVSQFLREQGFEPEEVFTERAAELKRLAELGIPMDSSAGFTAPAGDTNGTD